ncbi:penicillin-binding protein 2 [bacterium]|jgi:penicillin-binding protein 2|nr:penicillin-binding protein 2 [bacterium]MBT3795866.1 penicillin-binding protein 2 [bacterium]MBT4634336.1 penicillin-binding protein 2 [bacterium]
MAKSERSNLSILIVSVLLLVVLFRLFYIQIINGNEYRRISSNNFLKEVIVPSPRGSILDRFGKEIAVSEAVVNLYYKRNPKDDLNKLKKFLISDLQIERRIVDKAFKESKLYNNKNKRFILKENLGLKNIYRVENKLNSFMSLELVVDYLRVYPFASVGAHKIGYLKSNDKRDIVYGSFLSTRLGASGLEKIFNKRLQGSNGSRYLLIDSRGNEVLSRIVSFDRKKVQNKSGKDLTLTIDIEMEKLIYSSFGNFNGAAMVHEIKTGEILALLSKPSFDPNKFSKSISVKEWNKIKKEPHKPFLNRTLLSTNPPGSIIKIVTAVAALEEGVINESSQHYCRGYFELGGRKFRCWKQGGHGKVNVVSALITSCDVFFYKVGLSLGIKKYSKWLKSFGFSKRVSLPFSQNRGVIPSADFISKYLKGKWYKGDMVNVAIGQGYLTVNTVQASIMTSIIASNGAYPDLKIVSREEKDNRTLAISKKNLSLIQKGLLGVVNDRNGTGFHARSDGKLAGKTGTAQVISKSSTDYNVGEFKNHGWYTSYYPFEDPKIVITIFVENGVSGGRSGGPIIKNIVNYYKKNYLIRPGAIN